MRKKDSIIGLACAAGMLAASAAPAKEVLLFNRIGPTKSELYVANADGSGEHKLLVMPGFDYAARFSDDGRWIAFTSDRNTEWKSHDKGVAWEHLQELAVYIVHPDGTGLKRLSPAGVTTGSPKWSDDDRQLIAYQGDVEVSWLSRVDQLSMKATTQIVAIDVASGQSRELTSGAGVKLYPQFLPDGRFGYSTKSAQVTGIMYSDGPRPFPANLREPPWTRDGSPRGCPTASGWSSASAATGARATRTWPTSR